MHLRRGQGQCWGRAGDGARALLPCISGFRQVYLTVTYLIDSFVIGFLIFSKPAAHAPRTLLQNHVCRPLAQARPTPCDHAHANLGGSHHEWNEHLYHSARRRPQLNPRGPTACGHRRFERACQLCMRGYTLFCLGCLQPYTPGRILGWTPNTHSANVYPASCVYSVERVGRSIEEKVPWDPPVFLKRPRGPTQ